MEEVSSPAEALIPPEAELSEDPPRWEHDKTVIANGWNTPEHCDQCGEINTHYRNLAKAYRGTTRALTAIKEGEPMIPTVGRIVHYFPGKHDTDAKANGLGANDPVTAVIVRAWVDGCPEPEVATLNLRLLLDSTSKDPTPCRTSIVHRSKKYDDDAAFWDWPERV